MRCRHARDHDCEPAGGVTQPTSEKTGLAKRIGMAEEAAMSETTSPMSRGRDKRTESRR